MVFPPVPVPSLCSHICTTSFSLPEIQDELEKSIYTTREALRQLPREPSQQPVNEVATLLHEFVTDLVRHIAGVPDEKGLIQSFRPAQDRFRSEIRLTAPRFRPYERGFLLVGKCLELPFWTMNVMCPRMMITKVVRPRATITKAIPGNQKGALYMLMKFLNELNGTQ